MWIFVFVYTSLFACVISSTMDIFTGSVRYLLRICLRVVNYVVNYLQMYNKKKKKKDNKLITLYTRGACISCVLFPNL